MTDFHSLRKRAEQELKALSDTQNALLLSTQQLIQELEIHRIELKMQNQALQESQLEIASMRDKYQELYDFAPIGYLTLNEEGIIQQSNLKGAKLLGVYRSDLFGQHLQNFIQKADQDHFFLYLSRVMKQEQYTDAEFHMTQQDGKPFYAQLESLAVFDENEVFSHIKMTLVDITAQKHAQMDLQKRTDQLRKSLTEKELLIQEVHHRVKNNLQMIISLLRMQTRNINNTFATEQLQNCEKRIQVISDLHEILYQNKDFSDVCLLSFFKRLINNLCFIYNHENLVLDFDISVQGLDFEKAMYCGLIVNELTSNVLKHAFPASWVGTPTLKLEFGIQDNKHYVLKLSDNGIGLSHNSEKSTLGLSLVDMFIQKLNGKKSLSTSKGMSVEIVFCK